MSDILSIYLMVIPALAICFGIFGSFAIWERNSFFSHIFSHSLLLPLSISFLTSSMSYHLMIMIVFAIIFTIFFHCIDTLGKQSYSRDTVLAILSFFCMSMALFISSIYPSRGDIMSYMSGNVLFISTMDIAVLYAVVLCLLLLLKRFYRTLVLKVISVELAISADSNAGAAGLVFMILQAIFITIGCQAVGVLLVSATMIMPSVLSRLISKNPGQMILLAILFGLLVMLCGATLSIFLNTQFSPVVIVGYCACFMAIILFKYANNAAQLIKKRYL